MKAITQDHFGSADTLRLTEVPLPVPDDTSVVVKVRAASVNALDYRIMSGKPAIGRLLFGFGLTRPKRRIRGVDVAGVVESVNPKVTGFSVGDEVFGVGSGSFAEFVAADVIELSRKPASLSFEDAAALPVAGVTALQGLRDKAQVRPGESVLVTGAGGGVGTYAVQIAKALGATVTAVSSGGILERLPSLGADRTVDAAREDYARTNERFDVIFDVRGDRPFRVLRRLLRPGGRIVAAGGAGLGRFLKAGLVRSILRYPVVMFVARVRSPELAELARLASEQKLRPVVERTYSLAETPEALRHAASHGVRGKLVIALPAS